MLVHTSHFISVDVQIVSAIFTICKWPKWCRNVLRGMILAEIKTHGSESRGQEEAGLRDERVAF